MNFFFNEEPEGSNKKGGKTVTLTTAMFFGKDGKTLAYTTPAEWLEFGKSLNPKEANDLDKGFKFMKEGLKHDGGSDVSKDIAGKQYQWFTFFRAKARPGCKIVCHESTIRLFIDYGNGSINIDFTLEELIAEARKDL